MGDAARHLRAVDPSQTWEPPVMEVDLTRTVGVIAASDVAKTAWTWCHAEIRRVLDKLDPTLITVDASMAGHSAATIGLDGKRRVELIRPGRTGKPPFTYDGVPINTSDVPWAYDLHSPFEVVDHTETIGSEISWETWQEARTAIVDTCDTLVIVSSSINRIGPLRVRAARHGCEVITIDASTKRTTINRRQS